MEELVEAADKRLIADAQAPNDGIEALPDLAGIFPVQVVVNQQDHGEGKSFRAERNDSLLDVVLQDAEFVSAQVGDQSARTILHRNWDDDLINHRNNLRARLLRLLSRQSLRLRGRGRTLLSFL